MHHVIMRQKTRDIVTRIIPVFLVFLSMALLGQSAETRARFQGTAPNPPPLAPNPLRQQLRGLPLPPPPPPMTPEKAAALPPMPEFSPALSLSAEWATRYMRDGWCRNDQPVGILQAEFSEGVGYVGVRGVYDFTDAADRQWKFQEAWFYAGVSTDFTDAGDFGPVSVDLSWTHNVMPGNSGENHGEIGLGFYLNEMYAGEKWTMTSGLQFDYDYDRHAVNARLHLRGDWLLNDDGTLRWNASAALYWGDTRKLRLLTDERRHEHGFYASVWRTGLEWDFAPGWTLSPEVSLSYVPERPVRRIAEDDRFHHPAVAWGGIRLTCRL